jgi:F420H(2)-dependent quinone reductase
MPVLVLTTVGRKSGKRRSTPVGFLRFGDGYAVIASNAGSDRVPAWWLNLQADPAAEVLTDRKRHAVRARRATATEDDFVWAEFARLNPGFDEYRTLTDRRIPVVILERDRPPTAADGSRVEKSLDDR